MSFIDQIIRQNELSSVDLRSMFEDVEVSQVSDVMGRQTGTDGSLKRYSGRGTVVGRAVTVRTRAGDNLIVHKALDMIRDGQVLVVDAGGSMDRAIIGELMVARAVEKGVRAIIINGCIRDVEAISEMSLPVYALGVTHKGPYKTGPGAINIPVAITGQVFNPGEVVFGDSDGLVTLPEQYLRSVTAEARKKKMNEEDKLRQIHDSENIELAVDDQELMEAGYHFVEQ